ncbi:retrovirus-related pol polyprotein from transposon TNT 1-94 [Tanacetum coccineum]|uniref:Retrovirus-related pol polyprotein from transposon TNT 1-94 n=1 Tax=Tanacetum coccineum TaxID=301880 RepID=A0ABQ4ZMZ7_9ASTR
MGGWDAKLGIFVAGKVAFDLLRDALSAIFGLSELKRNNARGNVVVGNVGGQNRGGIINPRPAKPIKCYNYNGLGHIERECPRPKQIQDSDYFKDEMLLMQAQENDAVLDEEQSLFLAGEQIINFDEDVDNSPENDMALNRTHIFEADDGCSRPDVNEAKLKESRGVEKADWEMSAGVINGDQRGKKVALVKLNCGYQWRPTGKKFILGELCPSTKLLAMSYSHLGIWTHVFKTYDWESFKLKNFRKVHRTAHYAQSTARCESTAVMFEVFSDMLAVQSFQVQIMFEASSFKPLNSTINDLARRSAPTEGLYRIYNNENSSINGNEFQVTIDEMDQRRAPCTHDCDEYLKQSRVNEPVPSATDINAQVVPPGTSLSTTIAQDAPSTSASSSTSDMHHPVRHQEITEETTLEDPPINHDVLHPSHNLVTGDPGSVRSSSENVNSAEPNQVNYPPDHLRRWTKDHPLDNIVGNPSHLYHRENS